MRLRAVGFAFLPVAMLSTLLPSTLGMSFSTPTSSDLDVRGSFVAANGRRHLCPVLTAHRRFPRAVPFAEQGKEGSPLLVFPTTQLYAHPPTNNRHLQNIKMKLIAAAPLLLMVTLALSLPFHQLEARIEAGATSQKLDPLQRRGNVHHSNNGPPGPNGPTCEHPPCPGLTRDLNGYDAPDRREMAVGLAKGSSSPGIGPLERGDAGPHFGPGPVQPTCERPRLADDRPARRSCTAH